MGLQSMSIIKEIRHRAKYVIGPFVGIFAVGYFGFHVVYGDRGVFAWRQVEQRLEKAQNVAEQIRRKRFELEFKVRLLKPQTLDGDMLEERARLMLNYGHENDLVIMDLNDSSRQ